VVVVVVVVVAAAAVEALSRARRLRDVQLPLDA
jgi:hypothetical protein